MALLDEFMSRNGGNGCKDFLTSSELKALTTTTSKSTSKSNRRLPSTSKSKSSDSLDFDTSRFITDGDCTYEIITGPSKSTSKSKERRRLTKTTTTSSKSASGGKAVARCIGDGCEDDGCLPLTHKEFKALGLTNKSSTSKSSDDRRLVSTSKSTSKSTSTDDAETRFIGNCEYRLVASSPKSSSKSSSKGRRRLHKPTTSSKSSGGGGYRVRTVGDTTVRCVGTSKRCKKCHDSSNARKARNFAFSYLSGSKSKGSSKSNRRLAHTPKSSSKSSSYDDDDFLEVRYHSHHSNRCKIDWVRTVDFDSSSTSSSKSKGR